MSLSLRAATIEHLDVLLPMVASFHESQGISNDNDERKQALIPLLQGSQYGQIYLIQDASLLMGYLVVCFGYSIEMGGRDAFIDEFFIESTHRNRGLGREALGQLPALLHEQQIRAVHLEVDRCNERLQALYQQSGFTLRSRYTLMTRILD